MSLESLASKLPDVMGIYT